MRGWILSFSLLLSQMLNAQNNYQDLVDLFFQWRDFEKPPMLNGVPNYTITHFDHSQKEFKDLLSRLNSIDTTDFSTEQKIDLQIVKAEMNGYDFNYRVLRPWERDPAFYQTVWMYESDVPAHEGPTNHFTIEFWTYNLPLSVDQEAELQSQFDLIPFMLDQAKENLTGNARDLWIAGIENFKQQDINLKHIKELIGNNNLEIISSLDRALAANQEFIFWLEELAPLKKGPSGIGKENYTWYQKNVHLLPFTWEEEVELLKRELDRAWSSLKLEEQRNHKLPDMVSASSPEEFAEMSEESVNHLMEFLKNKDIMYIKSNMEPALRKHTGKFVPEKERNFFQIGMHYDPLPLYSHFYHWFDLAQVKDEPHTSPIRRGPLLYNIFDSKSEGIATGVEEMFMHSGLYDNNPRSREIVWIMLAQRAARGLGSLYAHANQMTMEEAGNVHVKWTPRGWMKRELHLLKFEQHLYLRQPGYGTCYITGKYVIEGLITKYAKAQEDRGRSFVMKEFMKLFNDAGNIPVSLVEWEITGSKPKSVN